MYQFIKGGYLLRDCDNKEDKNVSAVTVTGAEEQRWKRLANMLYRMNKLWGQMGTETARSPRDSFPEVFYQKLFVQKNNNTKI